MTKITLKDCELKYNELCRALQNIAFSENKNEDYNFLSLQKIEGIINEIDQRSYDEMQ